MLIRLIPFSVLILGILAYVAYRSFQRRGVSRGWHIAVFAAMLSCHGIASSAETVDGPESADLIPALEGHLVWAKPRGELSVVDLPSRKETLVRSPAPAEQQTDFPVIHSVSGPDSQGRIAYIEDWFFTTRKQDQKHRLKMIRVDGTQDQEIFVRQGSAMWSATAAGDGRIGSQLALAPSGGRVALVTDIESIQMETPPACLVVGALEIWNLTQRSERRIAVQALDQATPYSNQLSWCPDGFRLAYVELITQDRANGAQPMEDGFGGFRLWPRLPAVHVLNVDTGERRFLRCPEKSPNTTRPGRWTPRFRGSAASGRFFARMA